MIFSLINLTRVPPNPTHHPLKHTNNPPHAIRGCRNTNLERALIHDAQMLPQLLPTFLPPWKKLHCVVVGEGAGGVGGWMGELACACVCVLQEGGGGALGGCFPSGTH